MNLREVPEKIVVPNRGCTTKSEAATTSNIAARFELTHIGATESVQSLDDERVVAVALPTRPPSIRPLTVCSRKFEHATPVGKTPETELHFSKNKTR